MCDEYFRDALRGMPSGKREPGRVHFMHHFEPGRVHFMHHFESGRVHSMHLLERPGITDGLDEPITGAYDGTPIAKLVRKTHPTS